MLFFFLTFFNVTIKLRTKNRRSCLITAEWFIHHSLLIILKSVSDILYWWVTSWKRWQTLLPSPPWGPGEWTGEVVGELGRMLMKSGSMSCSNNSKMFIPSDPSAEREKCVILAFQLWAEIYCSSSVSCENIPGFIWLKVSMSRGSEVLVLTCTMADVGNTSMCVQDVSWGVLSCDVCMLRVVLRPNTEPVDTESAETRRRRALSDLQAFCKWSETRQTLNIISFTWHNHKGTLRLHGN